MQYRRITGLAVRRRKQSACDFTGPSAREITVHEDRSDVVDTEMLNEEALNLATRTRPHTRRSLCGRSWDEAMTVTGVYSSACRNPISYFYLAPQGFEFESSCLWPFPCVLSFILFRIPVAPR